MRLPGEPDPALTPGAFNPAVTQATIGSTICRSGWTATVRPPSSYTTGLKVQQIAQYGYTDTSTASYEEDHLIPLELGGAPRDPRNLWPEPYTASLSDGRSVGARVKDVYETALKKEVCAGTISLASARLRIGIHWVHYDLGIPLAATTAASQSPKPALTPTPQPTTASTAVSVRLTTLPSSVAAGSSATVAAHTATGATCKIAFTLPSGRVSTVAALLQTKTAGSSGTVAWTWTITSNTKPGTARVAVTCAAGGRSASASGTFAIT